MRATRCIFVALDGATPVVLREYMKQGELPNFQRLADRGVWFDQCLTAFPTITPTCWATIATGTPPMVHGVISDDVIRPGDPFDKPVSGYRSELSQAEYFWEAAARVGRKSLVMGLPTSGPARDPLVMQVMGIRYFPADVSTYTGERVLHGKDERLVRAELDPATKRATVDEFDIEVVDNVVKFADATGLLAELKEGRWSEALEQEIEGETARFKVKVLAIGNGAVDLYISPIGLIAHGCSPEVFAQRMAAIPMMPPFTPHDAPFSRPQVDLEEALEIESQNVAWMLEAVRDTFQHEDPAFTVIYTSLSDTIGHIYKNVIEGYTEISPEDKAIAVRAELETYKTYDRMIGELLDMADKETLVVVTSDHGTVGYAAVFDQRKALEQAGLTVFDPETGKVDLTKSKAIPHSTVHIFVNTTERGGIVPPEEYEATVDEIIKACMDFEDDHGRRLCAIALRRNDAQILGLGGPRTGDVVTGVTNEVGGKVGGMHACNLPTALSKHGDMRSLFAMAGPNVRKGETLSRNIRTIDIAPTMCWALGLPMPAQAEGAIIYQAFEQFP